MKTLILFVLGMLLIFAGTMQAQVSVNVNIGSPPPWGPYGYSEVRYYYLPDVEAYYDIHTSRFIYISGGNWIHRTYLPARYKNYDLYNGYKVVIKDYNGNAPYNQFKEHKSKYAKGYHGQYQKTIGEKPGKGNSDKQAVQVHKKNNNSGNKKNNNHGGGHGKKMEK